MLPPTGTERKITHHKNTDVEPVLSTSITTAVMAQKAQTDLEQVLNTTTTAIAVISADSAAVAGSSPLGAVLVLVQ